MKRPVDHVSVTFPSYAEPQRAQRKTTRCSPVNVIFLVVAGIVFLWFAYVLYRFTAKDSKAPQSEAPGSGSIPDDPALAAARAVSQSAAPTEPEDMEASKEEEVKVPEPSILARTPVESARDSNLRYTPVREWNADPQEARGVVVGLLHGDTESKTKALLWLTFPALDAKFLVPQKLALLMSYTTPCTSEEEIVTYLRLKPTRSQFAGKELGEGVITHNEYVTRLGTVVILERVEIYIPKYLVADPSLLNRPDYRLCAWGQWPATYIASNAFFPRQAFASKTLDWFDFFLKVDTDVYWETELEFKIVPELASKKAIFMHALQTTDPPNCAYDLQAGVMEYEQLENISGDKQQSPFWPETVTFYGNFIGGWLGFWQSPEVQKLSRHLEEFPKGYYKHRWTDQQFWPKALYLYLPVEEQRSRVVDHTPIRDVFFRHENYFSTKWKASRFACETDPDWTRTLMKKNIDAGQMVVYLENLAAGKEGFKCGQTDDLTEKCFCLE